MESSHQESRVEEAPPPVDGQFFSLQQEKLPQKAVFGPFWRVGSFLGLVNYSYNPQYANPSAMEHSEKPLIKRMLPIAVSLLGASPLFARTIWMITQMSDFKLWTVNWAYATLLFIFSLHSFACFVVLKLFNRNHFFDQFFKKIIATSKNKIFCQENTGFFTSFYVKYSLLGVVVLFFVYSMGWFSLENAVVLSQLQANASAVPFFRNSMFGHDSMPLLVFDTLILVWASLVSSVAMVLIFLLNNTIYQQYAQFHEEVSKLSAEYQEKKLLDAKMKRSVSMRKNGGDSSKVSDTSMIQFNNLNNNELASTGGHPAGLNDPQKLSFFDSQLIDFICLIKNCNTATEPLITISFMCAMFSYVVSTFAVRSFKNEFNVLQKITFYNWMVLSLMFVFITLVPLAKLHTKMRETKNLILLEKAIWKEYNPEVFTLASNMIKRVDMVDYESRLFSAIRVTSAFFNLLLLIVPFVVDYVLTPETD